MQYYFDTSAICRYYHAEPGLLRVEAIDNQPNATLVLSWLTILETQSAFALKVRTGEIDSTALAVLSRKLKADIASRRFLVVRLLRRHFQLAEALILKHGPTRRLRSLDALHLAVSLDLRSINHIDALVTADTLLQDVATLEGLVVSNPLAP